MKKPILIIIVLLVVVLGYFIYAQRIQPKNIISTSPTPTNTSITNFLIPTDKVNELKQGGSSYMDKNGVFTFLYPNDYQFDEQNNGEIIRVFKQGPSQKGQTEMYDGVILTFQSINLNGQTLEEFVDQTIKNASQDGTSEITSPKKSIVINGYPGFTYTSRGLGEFPHYIFQKETTSDHAVIVSTLVADPENIGFQDWVNAILGTITFQK